MDEEKPHLVEKFVEKPKTFISNKINAGIYILSPKVIGRIEDRPTSIEREIFPKMVGDRALGGFVLKSYWMDIGQPGDYLAALNLFLAQEREAPQE